MNELQFYVETARYAAIKKLCFILAALPMALLIFTGILVGMGEHNDFVRICKKLSVPAAVVVAGCTAGGLYVYYKHRQRVTLSHQPQGMLQIVARSADGTEYGKTGRWSFHALYTRHYHKYGTYKKELYLILFCNNEMFCMMRHEVAPAFPPPPGFKEIASPAEVFVPIYFTRKTEEVCGIIRHHMMNQQPQQSFV